MTVPSGFTGVAVVSILVLCGLVAAIMVTTCAADSSARQLPTLLVLATRIGNENIRGNLIDPAVEAALRQKGWVIEQRSIEEATREHLDAADAVVMIQTPYTSNVAGTEAFKKFLPVLDDYLQDGGALALFVDERYFHVLPNVNLMLEPYGLSVLKERLVDETPGKLRRLEHDSNKEILRTSALKRDHPVVQGLEELWLPLGDNGACTFPVVVCDEWDVIVAAEPSSGSLASWTDQSSHYQQSPPVIVARTIGNGGRLIVIPAHSSFTFLHGSHWRWDEGFFLRTGWMTLIENALRWCAESPHRPFGEMPPSTFDPKTFADMKFKPVEEAQQRPPEKWQKGTTVLVSSRPEDLGPWRRAAEGKVNWLAVAIPGEKLSGEDYATWVRQCAQASTPVLSIIPAVQVMDGFDNRAVLLVPKKWPITRSLRSLNHILHDVQGHMVLLQPERNPWPAWNIGGFHGYALVSYAQDARAQWALETFRRLQAADWFLVPHSIDEADSPEDLARQLAGQRQFTYVAAGEPGDVAGSLPQLFHNPREVYLSGGPRLDRFDMTGPSLIDDVFEGIYYLWAGPQDHGTLRVRISSDNPLREVRIYRDSVLWRRYQPDNRQWELELKLQSDEGSRSMWIEAEDVLGRRMISTTSRTRSLTYWAHGGGDRMNTYANQLAPSDNGTVSIHGQRMSIVGAVYFGLGWGDWLRMRPAIFNHEMVPAGREWGLPGGAGLESIQIAPRLTVEGKTEFATSKPQRAGYSLAQEQVAILHQRVDAGEGRIDGKRRVVPASLITAETVCTTPRWKAGGAVTMILDTEVRPLRPLELSEPAPLQVLELLAKGDKHFAHLSFARDGAMQREEILGQQTAQGITGLKWAVMWPDPQGAVGVYALDGRDYTARAVKSSAGPRLSWSTTIPAGTWMPDQPLKLRYAIAIGPGHSKQADQEFAQMARAYGGEDIKLTLSQGKEVGRLGSIDLLASQGLVEGELSLPEGLLPHLVRIAGVSPRVPQYWRGVEDELFPIGRLGDTAYRTLQGGASSAFAAGNIVQVDDAAVQVDVSEATASRLSVWVHNPTAEPVDFTIVPEARLWGPGEVRQITLKPGQDELLTWMR